MPKKFLYTKYVPCNTLGSAGSSKHHLSVKSVILKPTKNTNTPSNKC